MINIRVLFFAALRDRLKQEEQHLQVSPKATIMNILEEIFPDGKEREAQKRSLKFAINQEFVDINAPLKDGDEVALLPPMSGG